MRCEHDGFACRIERPALACPLALTVNAQGSRMSGGIGAVGGTVEYEVGRDVHEPVRHR